MRLVGQNLFFKQYSLRNLLLTISCATLVNPSVAMAIDHWSSFQNGGQLTSLSLPETWNADGTNIAWKISVEGYGQSSPIVQGDQVFVTSTSGPNKEKYHVAAYSLKDGNKQWQHEFANPTPEENNSYVSRAAPSPVADANGLVCSFEGGIVAAFSLDGKLRWEKNLVTEYGPIKARHGLAASLEQDASNAYVWVEREEAPYILSLNKATGEVTWKADGVGATSWSSPRLISVSGKPQLVCSSSGRIAGYDTATGNKLWEFTDVANNTTCTPIPVADGKFIVGASDGRGEQGAGKTAASNGLLEVKPTSDGKFAVNYLWRAEKATCSFGSPIVAAEKVWLVNRAGVLFQLDLATGKQLSAERVASGSIWATPLATSSKLYLFGQKGMTSIIDLSNASEITSCSTWEEPAEAAPAAMGGSVLYAAVNAGNTLLIRRGDAVYAIRQK
jgi:outer membrane protein assembly factor BamB